MQRTLCAHFLPNEMDKVQHLSFPDAGSAEGEREGNRADDGGLTAGSLTSNRSVKRHPGCAFGAVIQWRRRIWNS